MLILKLLCDLGVKTHSPINIFCDNEFARKLALNPIFHKKTKHFEVDLHFVREKIENGILKVNEIESSNQKANILTKSLGSSQHEYILSHLGLIDVFKEN